LLNNSAHVEKARAEFARRTEGRPYRALVGDQKPPLDYRK